MKGKWVSSIMAGIFIAMGAMVYLSVPNTLIGSMLFATGIFLVLNLHNMLITRVCPLMVYDHKYHWTDIGISWIGNGLGTLAAALIVYFTRFETVISNSVKTIAETKLSDTPQSLFLLGILCACFVAFAVLIGAKQEQGSFGQIFYVWLFITAFVFCGFEHIVADMFYLSCYALYFGAEALSVIKVLGCVTAGNLAGGLFIAWAVRKLDKKDAASSRTLERAEIFAREYGFDKAYGSYEERCEDPEVELIYIATPHSCHYENMELCIRHKKPVLCEKSFTLNAGEAERIKALARQEQVFAAEAIWTRYMPSRHMIQEIIDSGIIGDISVLTANLSYPITRKERIMRPELAGGALLDIGVYGLNFALMHFGTDIERIESSVRMTDTGVDGMESITIFFRSGRMAVLTHDIYGRSDRKGIFYGEKGYIIVENINNPQSISVYDTEDRLIKKTEVPDQISGYEYEVLECMEAVRAGEKESTSMPLDDSIEVMRIMDQLRGQWGLVYPQEREQQKQA